ISRRMLLDEVRDMAEENGVKETAAITPDTEIYENQYDSYTSDKVTVLTYFYRNKKTGTIWCCESTRNVMVRKPYDTDYQLYPLVWLNWDYIQDCYHGQALITGLIPNQNFVNKI